ncbi:hypothetical protein TRP8649_01393 [Pelagimonas phthalicica]|uniref:Gp37 protein n=1 Tax=Pelagimonas phthalicica TaxID=1037362 RepID=A0A238J9A3_9RHOB|nr:hypothetical protein [Pelagimonas phthalicica]TDS94185.1 hypothetical protein CLV87_0679 [Pelagimonas phthalicica]SMX27290.1 hypothetical protein TRP8649_01393 [Pelagimonas phthalicica]
MPEEIDLGEALNTVVETLKAQFPTFKTVAAEDQDRKELQIPAIIVQMTELEPDLDSDAHTGQFPCLIHLEARIVMGHRTPQVRREVVRAAGALSAFIHSARLGVGWGAAQILAVEPDEFSPVANSYEVWMVEWVHSADIGESYFVDDGVTPTQVLTSWTPQIGVDHEADYEAQHV